MNITNWIQIITLSICFILIAAKDYYEILGVKRDASDKEIKRRFRQPGGIFLPPAVLELLC